MQQKRRGKGREDQEFGEEFAILFYCSSIIVDMMWIHASSISPQVIKTTPQKDQQAQDAPTLKKYDYQKEIKETKVVGHNKGRGRRG